MMRWNRSRELKARACAGDDGAYLLQMPESARIGSMLSCATPDLARRAMRHELLYAAYFTMIAEADSAMPHALSPRTNAVFMHA